MNIQKHFDKLVFDPIPHTYHVDKKQLTSATTHIHKYHDEFPSRNASRNKAKSQLKSNGIILSESNIKFRQNQILKQWKDVAEEASIRGTEVHDFAENYAELLFWGKGKMELPNRYQQLSAIHFLNYVKSLNYELVETECRMYLIKMGIAGTADIIFRKPNGNYIIADYKTNKDIFKTYGKKMLTPFNNMVDCPYNKYQIQLSLYQLMVESVSSDTKVDERWLIWLKPENYNSDEAFDVLKEPDVKTPLFEIYKTKDLTQKLVV